MASMTDFLEGKVIDHLLRGQAYTVPTTIYLALCTSATDDAGGGTEVTGGSYARQPITLAASGGTGTTTSTSDCVFTNMPGVTVTHGKIMDAVSGGNALMHGALVASKNVPLGEALTIAAGDIDISFD